MSLKSAFLKALTRLTFQREAVAGMTVPFFGQNFQIWNDFWRSTGPVINYEKELGDLRSSALLMAAYQWLSSSLNSARLTVVTLDSDNKETEVQNHPLVELFDQPNPYYGSEELLSGIALSWLVSATAYVLKVRNGAGGVNELWYEPWWSIRPVWPADGSQFISGYEINRSGYWLPVATEDVFVLRKGIDPDTRMGQSTTQALLREYYTDREAAQFAALLMRQGLVPPLMVSVGDKDRPVSELQAAEIKQSLMRQMSGSDAGKPIVTSAPHEASTLNFDYSKMGLRDVRAIPEERFCAAMGISPYSLHFGTSRSASTFSNVKEYLQYDYKAVIVPMHNYIAKRLARELLPEFGPTDNLQVRWNYDDAPLMQADQTVEWKRVAEAYKARILDQAEAREAIGYKSDDSHIGVYYPVPGPSTTENELGGAPDPAATASSIVNKFDQQSAQDGMAN